MKIRSEDHYFLPGTTYGKRTDALNVAILPKGCLFSHEGQAVFATSGEEIWTTLAYLNSCAIREIANQICASHKVAGYVNKLPVSEGFLAVAQSEKQGIRGIVRILQTYSRQEEDAREFLGPALPRFDKDSFVASLKCEIMANCANEVTLMSCINRLHASSKAFLLLQRPTDIANDFKPSLNLVPERVISALSGSDRSSFLIERLIKALGVNAEEALGILRSLSDVENPVIRRSLGSVIAWLLGASYGRWDIRYATGERQSPELPDPFDPLPICPPGMLQNSEGLPAEPKDVPSDYPLRISWPGILVDDENHPEDIVARVREAIAVIWKGRAEAIEQEACGILGVQTLRDYFRRPSDFFADHLKRYTKSRRQAPIYWQLSSGNGSYSVWLYYHRFTADTLYQVLDKFIQPRIQEAEREQFSLESQGVLSGVAATRLQETQALLQDLRLLKKELDLVAALWNPNLNDGVIINHALLWRITPYSPWQKKCKECWDKLVNGDYDWAHLAFHLWPERVIRKCTTDRSLAIAHGLEECLWQETQSGNWLPKQISETDLHALITEHTKPSVQSALEQFLAAPPPVAAARTRAARSTSTGTTRRSRGTATPVDAEASRQTLFILNAAPAEGLSRNDIADLLGVEASSLTAVIKQLKETGQIEQLGAARGDK